MILGAEIRRYRQRANLASHNSPKAGITSGYLHDRTRLQRPRQLSRWHFAILKPSILDYNSIIGIWKTERLTPIEGQVTPF
jgi:hypothetical protein